MKRIRNAALGCTVAALALAQASTIVIDDFEDPVSPGEAADLDNPPGPATGAVYSSSVPGGMVGGQRDLTLAVAYTSDTTASIAVNTLTSQSRLSVNSGDFAIPTLTLTYDGNGAGLNVDLSVAALTLREFHTDLPLTLNLWLTTSAGNYYTASAPVLGAYSGDLTIASFTTIGSPDINHINDIKVEFVGTRGVDFSLHSINAVPEPSTYAGLTALGLLGMMVWRRTRA